MTNEKRLIDANAVIRTIRKADCDDCDNCNGILCRACWADAVISLLDDSPKVDAVEVVRCKDCEYYCHDVRHGTICRHPELDFDIECYDQWINTEPDDFCSYGERRTDV